MKIRKRNGSEVTFNKQNIVEAISRANEKVRLDAEKSERLSRKSYRATHRKKDSKS